MFFIHMKYIYEAYARSMVTGQRRSPLSLSAYKTPTKHGRRSETLTPLTQPTRPARSMVAGQRRSPLSLSAYKIRTKHDRRSETLTPLHLCTQVLKVVHRF